MKRTRFALKALLAGVASVACSAQAALVNQPLPTNAYISFGGYDWAWAFPLAPDGSSGYANGTIDLSYQAQFGWRLPTAAELLLAPDAVDFVFDGANVRYGWADASVGRWGRDPLTNAYFATSPGTNAPHPSDDAACAIPYFSLGLAGCGWLNGRGISSTMDWWNPDKTYGIGPGKQQVTVDTLVIRGSGPGPSGAPEPGTLALIGLGLAGLAMTRRRH